jgi:PKD repeat protein
MRPTLFWIALAALAAAVPAPAAIFISPGQPNADQAVTFSLSVSSGTIVPSSVLWSFGDGATATGQIVVQKTYAAAGNFQVTARYSVMITMASMPITVNEQTTLIVSERRRIACLSPGPLVGQTVSFAAENFFSSAILWNFGDGTPAVIGGPSAGHVFAMPGSFPVTARDFGGAGLSSITTSVSVGVDISRRRITYAPPQPAAGFPVTLTARNFYSQQIRWDFGDGTASVESGLTATHVFARPGTYSVRAWDWNGISPRGGGPTSVPVPVSEASGMRSAFQISFLQLRFEDGLSYKVVPRGFSPLTASIDIKYEGTGLFQAQWLVDGMPFRSVSQALSFAQSATLDCGRMPGLPTQITGMHEISLRILRPDVGFPIPVIRYFVATETVQPPLRGMALNVETAEGLQGINCTLTMGELRVAADRYFILRGTVKSDLPAAVNVGLLRVHLGTRLIDQQLVRALGSGESRPFVTSIRSAGAETESLYLTLYDISNPSAPRLLALKKFTVRSGP